MRFGLSLAALLVALTSVGPVSAQFVSSFGNNSAGRSNRITSNTNASIGSTSFLGSGFRLKDLFSSTSTPSNRSRIGSSVVPTPGTAGYLMPFGIRRLY